MDKIKAILFGLTGQGNSAFNVLLRHPIFNLVGVFTRKKFDSSFPMNAIMACLKKVNLTFEDINCVAFYEDPNIKLDRINNVNNYFNINSK